jgi:hypothetical protein
MRILQSLSASKSTNFRPKNTLLASGLGLLLLAGCGGQTLSKSITPAPHAAGRNGSIYGGQQPVTGASVQLYAVGTTGDGSAATPLFTSPVVSDGSGNFTFAAYTCPTPNTLVYIVATGGNPGLPGPVNNTALALMAAIGQCGNINSSTFINLNEITTITSVFSLAPYMTSFDHVGSGPSDAAALITAFGNVSQLVNISTGTVPGPALLPGYGVPVEQINTLADILAVCVNSTGGVSGDTSSCGQLFQYSGGGATTNTVTAAIQIANNPTANTSQLFALVPPNSPFQPTLTVAPSTFSVSILPQAPAPQLTPAGGPFPVTVTITAALTGTRIYYTTDGSTPTAGSTLYTTPFPISTPTTVNAIAVVPGYSNSPVASMGYGVVNPGYTVKTVNVCNPVGDERTGCHVYAIAVNSSTNTIYIGLETTGGADPERPGNLTILDGNTDVPTSWLVTGLSPVWAAASNPVTNKIYMASGANSTPVILDGNTNALTSLNIDPSTHIFDINPTTNKIYAIGINNLYVVDGATGNLTTTIPVSAATSAISINQVTNSLFVGGSPFLNINATTNTVVDAVTVAASECCFDSLPKDVAVNTVTNKVYIAADNVVAYDPVSLTTTTIVGAGYPDSIVVNPTTNTIYSLGTGELDIIDGATNTVISTIPITDFTDDLHSGKLIIDPLLNKLYVIATDSNSLSTISVVDLSTNTPSVIVSGQPMTTNSALNPTTHKLYVSEYIQNVLVISPN